MRAIISLNWLLGTLFFIVAFGYPVLDKQLVNGKKTTAEVIVARIAEHENRQHQLRNQYDLFREKEMPDAIRKEVGLEGNTNMEFMFSAFLAENGDLMIRARANDKAVKEGRLPPLTYLYRKASSGGTTTKEWTKLSGAQSGLW
ncbi:MAG: hypothetical protein HQM03_11120 [Magnetococcales bacterium]|nr:hypothetical protein [Magnetococcales bacterium]